MPVVMATFCMHPPTPMTGGASSLSYGCFSLINCYFCQCGGRARTWGVWQWLQPLWTKLIFTDYKERNGWVPIIFIVSGKLPMFKSESEKIFKHLQLRSLAISISPAAAKLIWVGEGIITAVNPHKESGFCSWLQLTWPPLPTPCLPHQALIHSYAWPR